MASNCQNASGQWPARCFTCLMLLTLFATCCKGAAIPADRRNAPQVLSRLARQITNNHGQLALPNGFTPPLVPKKPMQYPFDIGLSGFRSPVGATTPKAFAQDLQAATSDWEPIVGDMVVPRPSEPKEPEPEAELPVAAPGYKDQALESIVYGNWKPEPPEEPAMPPPTQPAENQKSVQRRRDDYAFSKEDYEIPEAASAEEFPSIEGEAPAMDANFRAQAEEVNSSVASRPPRTNPKPAPKPLRTTTTTEASFTTDNPPTTQPAEEPQPESTTTTTKSPKNWPTDFGYSNEQPQVGSEETSQEPTEMPAAVTTNVPEYNYNITKMGIPYEDQNSAEEPTICVPLRMRERSLAKAADIVDVERIYCFPLPHPTAAKSEAIMTLTEATGSWGSAQAVTNEPPPTTIRTAGTMSMDYAETDAASGTTSTMLAHILGLAMVWPLIGVIC